MSITILKSLLLRFFNIKIKQKVSTFPIVIVSVSWTGKLDGPVLLKTFQCTCKDGNVSGFSKYFNLSPRRNHFIPWHSLKECHIVCVCVWMGGGQGEMVLNLLPNFQKGSQSDWFLYRLYPGIPFIFTPFALNCDLNTVCMIKI